MYTVLSNVWYGVHEKILKVTHAHYQSRDNISGHRTSAFASAQPFPQSDAIVLQFTSLDSDFPLNVYIKNLSVGPQFKVAHKISM